MKLTGLLPVDNTMDIGLQLSRCPDDILIYQMVLFEVIAPVILFFDGAKIEEGCIKSWHKCFFS